MRHENMVAWSPEEDRIILEMHDTSGRKWGKIAAELSSRPGGGFRTSASVRNRYLRIEKGRTMRAEGKSKNRCAACGQQKLGHVCQARLNAARKPVVVTALAPAADDGAAVPGPPVVADEIAETLASFAGRDAVIMAQVADDTQAEAWPEPKKRFAWRKHEEQAAARMASKPGIETQAEATALVLPAEEERQSEVKPALRLESGNVLLLTKQPSGELIMYTMANQGAAPAL